MAGSFRKENRSREDITDVCKQMEHHFKVHFRKNIIIIKEACVHTERMPLLKERETKPAVV